MLENPPKTASFDHVDENGDLIFIFENTPLKIFMDDTLKHAITESQRIKDKSSEKSEEGTSTSSALPISQIQALIRAGIDPAHVSQRYHISESQVRRFSAGVETEKQYAIEQFLAVPAPKQSNMRNLSDLIERTLAKARIGMETVKWKATRRGLEPWRIVAQFNTATRTIKAEWTWNMHDNTVSCMNPSSRLLLGEEIASSAHVNTNKSSFTTPYRDNVNAAFPFENSELPGNSIRSARIERAISQWELNDKNSNANSLAVSNDANQFDSSEDSQLNNQNEVNTLADYVNKSSASAPKNSSNGNEKVSAPSKLNVKANHSSNRSNTSAKVGNKSDNATNTNISDTNSASESASKIAESSKSSRYSQEDLLLQKDDISKLSAYETSQLNAQEASNSTIKHSNKRTNSQKAEIGTSTNNEKHDSNKSQNLSDASTLISAENTNAAEKLNNEEKQRPNEHKRKSGRSAVPSWDEILFGEG